MRLYQPSTSRYTSSTSFSPLERVLLIGSLLAFLLGIAGYLWQRSHQPTQILNQGGTYIEGVINDSPTKLDRIEQRLTQIGLTYRDKDDTIKPALAESWEVSDNNKLYAFKIREGFTAQSLLDTIEASKTNWTGITITAPESSKLEFKLAEPLNSFLSTTTVQIFPYGPYELIKRDKKDTIFRANPRFPLQAPYIEKFQIRTFDTLDQLTKAADIGEIDGSADLSVAPSSRWQEYTIELPRYYLLFFNTTRPAFKKTDDRARVINELDGAQVAYNLVTTQSTTSSDLAENLKKNLAAKKIELNIQKKNSSTFQKEELAKRDFDLLLYGVDYGVFRDYYPFWHSSQSTAPGLNVSGYKNKDLDKLLEQARKTNDPTEHAKLNLQVEDHLKTNALQKIMYQEKSKFWVRSSIQDVKYGTIDETSDRFALVWQWNIK